MTLKYDFAFKTSAGFCTYNSLFKMSNNSNYSTNNGILIGWEMDAETLHVLFSELATIFSIKTNNFSTN